MCCGRFGKDQAGWSAADKRRRVQDNAVARSGSSGKVGQSFENRLGLLQAFGSDGKCSEWLEQDGRRAFIGGGVLKVDQRSVLKYFG